MTSQINTDTAINGHNLGYGSYQIDLLDGGINITVTATIGTFEYAGNVERGIRYTYRKVDRTRMDWATCSISEFNDEWGYATVGDIRKIM
tara:strand:+ start:146 stop:415 length:270 start_codon:yes stop_codon:yes gene_type:complete